MKRKIFLRFFSVTLCSVLLMFVFGVIAVDVNSEALVKERLKEETELICAFIKNENDFSGFKKYERDEAFRVTVLDLNGVVLYDSDTQERRKNHADREEIKNALSGTPKFVRRYSETFGFNMTYYAMTAALEDGRGVIVRLAVKSSRISGYLGVALPMLVGVLVISLVVSLVASGIFAKNVSDKIGEIEISLKTLNAGCYKPIKTDSGEPELFGVLSEINALSESTHEHIKKISLEHAKLSAVLENVSQGIIALDESKKIAFANQSALSIFDSAKSVLGKDFVYLVDDVFICDEITRRLGENFSAEYTYKNKQLSVTVRKIDSKSEGELFSIVIITEVTQEKALQKQKSDFFANASHELKTPVTVMQGLSEIMLSKAEEGSGNYKQIERIHLESLRLASLVSDMLELSRLEGGEINSRPQTRVDLRAVAEDVVQELGEQISQKQLSVVVAGEACVFADGTKMFELVQNICSNAVHYNKQNGKITIELFEKGGSTVLRVSDTGIGIEKEHLPRLCERFYRVDKSRSKKTGGTGLGLAIVKHICALYGAELSIESEIGVGTCVSVTFTA